MTKLDLPPRDGCGRFRRLECVNAHDRCYGGGGGECPYCEFAPLPSEKKKDAA